MRATPETEPALDEVVVVADSDAEAAALSLALSSAGLAAEPRKLEDVDDGHILVLLRSAGIDPAELRGISREVTVIAAGPSDVGEMLNAVECGALAYVEADAPLERFVAAIESARRNEATVPPHMLGALLHRVIEQQREQRHVAEQLEVLSPRERQVFELAVRGADKHALAERLFISPETARTHIQNVMSKLGASSRTELVGIAAAAGLPTTPPEGATG